MELELPTACVRGSYNSYSVEQYFYSRRIGRAPQRIISAPYVDAPDQTTIATAAKVSGRLGPWTVGVIDAVMPRESAKFASTGGTEQGESSVEPLTNYAVGRVRRDFRGGRTTVGGLLTAMHRDLGDTVFQPLM
ncbi:MAG: DUF5916 domain-containing protein [bacterium]